VRRWGVGIALHGQCLGFANGWHWPALLAGHRCWLGTAAGGTRLRAGRGCWRGHVCWLGTAAGGARLLAGRDCWRGHVCWLGTDEGEQVRMEFALQCDGVVVSRV
jgi:hypothetical protein